MNKLPNEFTTYTPVQLDLEIKKWKSIIKRNQNRYEICEDEEKARAIMCTVSEQEEYVDELLDARDRVNTILKEQRDNIEIACIEDIVPTEEPVVEAIVEKAIKSNARRITRKENKQKAAAAEVKEILEQVDNKKPKKVKTTEVKEILDRNELMKRKHVARKVGEKEKGKWKQVSFRIKPRYYETIKEHFRGEIDNGMKPTGIALSYGAEACVLGDFWNQRWFLDDRNLQNMKRFIKAAESDISELHPNELKSLQDNYAEMGLTTDEQKANYIASYKRIIDAIEAENLYKYRDEAAELKQRRTDADVRVATSEMLASGLKVI